MADGAYDPKPASVVEEDFFIYDPIEVEKYPQNVETITTIDIEFGFPASGKTSADIVSFFDSEQNEQYALLIDENHFLAQQTEFPIPAGTLIQVFYIEDAYVLPSAIQTLFSASTFQEFIDLARSMDPRDVTGQLQYMVDLGIVSETEVATINFTDAEQLGLVNQSSELVELTGGNVNYDDESGGSAKIMQTIFYNLMSKSGAKAIVYDFEALKSGDFTSAGYVSSTTMPGIVSNQQGNIHPDGNAGASLAYDDMLNVHLFNIGNNAPVSNQSQGDDPGVATNAGNNADRGFNTTPQSAATTQQYLEILPSDRTSASEEDIFGGAVFQFYANEDLMQDTRVSAFGFNLMGVEDAKRDVILDIFTARMLSNGDPEVSVSREYMEGSSAGGVQYISYALPDEPEFSDTVIIGFSLIESAVGPEQTRDIYSVDDLVLSVNSDSSFQNLVDPDDLLSGVITGGDGQNNGGDGQGDTGAIPSEDAPGPFWVDNDDRLVLTNIGATDSFNPSLQIVAEDLKTLELYDREMLQKVKDTKGHVLLSFVDTSENSPASVSISADIISEIGRTVSSGAKAALIETSAASTATIVKLIGENGAWKKKSLFGSDYEQMAKRLDADGSYTLYVNENDGKEVGILVSNNLAVTPNTKANPALSMEVAFFSYFGEFLERGDELRASDGDALDASQKTDGVLIQGDATANTITGGAGNDTIFGAGGNDTISAGVGSDYIDGGAGNDTIDGGENYDTTGMDFTPPIWETGDRVRYQGDRENYTITSNSDGSFTVSDDVGDDGIDTLTNVEILEFNDGEVLLVPETGSWSFQEWDPATNKQKLVSEDFADGTIFNDQIVGGDGRSFLRGDEGNDVLIGDGMSDQGVFASGQDMIEGGEGNDYIDGGGQGVGSEPWQQENAAEYYEASARRYTWVNDTDGTSGVDRLTATEAKEKAAELGINVDAKYFDNATDDQVFWLLTDKNGEDGLGTDIVTNIDVLRFGDKEIRLSVFKDTSNGFYQGTDFDDEIVVQVSTSSYAWSTFVEAGKGNDTVIGSEISDNVNLGAGDDFVDGGSQYSNMSEISSSGSTNSEEALAQSVSEGGGDDFTPWIPPSDATPIDDVKVSLYSPAAESNNAHFDIYDVQGQYYAWDNSTGYEGVMGRVTETNGKWVLVDDPSVNYQWTPDSGSTVVAGNVKITFPEYTSSADYLIYEDQGVFYAVNPDYPQDGGDAVVKIDGSWQYDYSGSDDDSGNSSGNDYFDLTNWTPKQDTKIEDWKVIENINGQWVEKSGQFSIYRDDPTNQNGVSVLLAVAASGVDKFIVVWDPMEDAYVVSDLQTAITTEIENLYHSGGFDDFDDDFDAGDFNGDFAGDPNMGPHGGMPAGGMTGDTVEYQGEFDRYIVTTLGGDELENSGLVSEDFISRIQALDAELSDPIYLVADTKITVVQDTVTGKNSTGTDVLVNVERLRFSDGEYNLAVTSELWGDPNDEYGFGEVNWRGTLGDDRIVDTSYDSERGYIVRDRMEGDAGNDLMISGAGGDRLIGGIGNDIMDGGANAALEEGNYWNIDDTIDIAEYRSDIDRFELDKITFEGKTISIKDANGNLAYVIKPKTKGETKIGEIFGVDKDGTVGTSVLYQVEEGDTFIVVSDTLPDQYGGVGTDILINMEKAQFGYDWEGNVEFQVQYQTHTWGGDGQVDATGTIFDDVIDLRAGKASTFKGGFGGFDDFNTGANIWDGDAFFNAVDNHFDDAFGGFDIWNWQPGPAETPFAGAVATLEPFFAGEAVLSGPFDIYKVALPVGDTFTLVAYDTNEQRVVEEVIARDAGGIEISLDATTTNANAVDYQVFYPDTSNDPSTHNPGQDDIYDANLNDDPDWELFASNVSVKWPDGYVEPRQFDIYRNSVSDEYVAAEFGYAFEPVRVIDIENNIFEFDPIDMGPGGNEDPSVDDFFKYWEPTPGADKLNQNGLVSVYGEGDIKLGKVYDIYEIVDPFDGETTYKGAFNTETNELEFQVEEDANTSGKYIIVEDNVDPQTAKTESSGSTPTAPRIHNSFINAGRGNDIILAGQGRDEIEGGIGDDFIDGGSESDFLSKFVGATAAASNVKLEDPNTGTPGVYSIYADTRDSQPIFWAWDGDTDKPSYFEVARDPIDNSFGIKLADSGMDFMQFNNDRFDSYDVAYYNGAQVRYEISEVYLKIDEGRPDLKSDGSYQVMTTTQYAAATVAARIGYEKVVQVKDLLPAVAGGEGTDYLLNIEAIRFMEDEMNGDVQLEQDSWYFANEAPVSDWMWQPENGQSASSANPNGGITSFDSLWGGSRDKWNDQATWNLYDYDVDQSIYAVVEEATYEWVQDFVTEKEGGGYVQTWDAVDWGWTPASGATPVEEISSYDFEWGGSNQKWNENTTWEVYSVGNDIFAVYSKETNSWVQGFVTDDGSGGYTEAVQISYEGGTNGTIRDDIIVSPDREQRDQIFGKEGNDIINAGRAIDRIKGGAGDDVIWGGTNVNNQDTSAAGSMIGAIEGDVAYFSSSSEQYTVIRNVYVQALDEGGDVQRDEKGRVKIYGEGAIPAKGVTVQTTADALTEANGYYQATIVVDALSDAAGGEGVDVLIGVEAIAFGATDEFYLEDFSMGFMPDTGKGSISISSLEITAYGQTTYNDSFNGSYWEFTKGAAAVYSGTDYDDTIRFDTLTTFENAYPGYDDPESYGNKDIEEYVFLGAAGDDIIVGDPTSTVKNTAVYLGSANEYDVTYNSATKTATVTHKLSDAQGGTGVDILKNIGKVVFNFDQHSYFWQQGDEQSFEVDPNVINLTPKSQTIKADDESIDGLAIFGTQFNDSVRSDAGQFKGRLGGDDLYFSGGSDGTSGHDYFDGGAGDNTLVLEGMPTRYIVTYNTTTSEFTFVDRLENAKGGEGTIKAKNISKVAYFGPDGPFELTIEGTGLSMVAKLYRNPDDPNGGGTQTLLTTSASIQTDGSSLPLLTSDDFNMFALSDATGPSAEHASTVTWSEILGDAVNFDAEVDVTTTPSNQAPAGWTMVQFDGGGGQSEGDTNVNPVPQPFTGMNGPEMYENSAFPNVMLKIDKSGDYQNGSWVETSTYSYEMYGAGKDDILRGSSGNDIFSGAPGDDTFDGRGETQVEDWFQRENAGDAVIYEGDFARYTIAKTGNDTYTVTDSLDEQYGGDGVDTLINIERIQFADRTYNLKIRDLSASWDTYKTIVGTDGDDLNFIDFTDDAADLSATQSWNQITYQLKGGAGDDIIVGGIEKKINEWDWLEGDTAIFGADSKYFNVSIEEVEFSDTSVDWDNSGPPASDASPETQASMSATDVTLRDALKAKFGGDVITRIVVEDTRDATAGGLGTDVLYGVENLQFGATSEDQGYDWQQRFKVEAEVNDWDGDGKVDNFMGTMFGDIFIDEDDGTEQTRANTWIDAGAGDDIIIAGGGGDSINPGAGNDFVNGQSNISQDVNDDWGSRDEVTFWNTPYSQVELEEVSVEIDGDGMAVTNADGQWVIYGYDGDAALTSEAVDLRSTAAPGGATKAYLVTDTKAGGIGTNLLVDIEAIGFSDQYIEVQGRVNEWSWTDWMTGETITEKSVEGTLFSENLDGAVGTDSLSGRGGDDIIRGFEGGDRLRGGTGNDLLDGGADGTSGDAWRDSDTAEYNGIEARYSIYQVKVVASAAESTLAEDGTSSISSAGNITVYDTAGTLPSAGLEGFTVETDVPANTEVITAYIVSDLLAGSLGGTGNDLLIGIEQVQFKESTIDLGLRIFKNDWNYDDASTQNYYDWVEVIGTGNADTIVDWGTANDKYAISDQDSANEIRGKGGNDVIFAYGGGDRISGGAGNDYIDGGDDGVDPEFGFVMKDEAIYDSSSRNYTVTTYTKDNAALDEIISKHFGTTLNTIKDTWLDGEKLVVVQDALPSSMGGTGVDILRNVEFLSFQDKFVALSVEEFIETDQNGLAIRAFVDGTDSDDVIGTANGQYDFSGNDELRGNDGDDTINGGKGGDFIEGGAGNDTIDGGENGIDRWSGEALGDTVRFRGNYADYEIVDEDINGELVITVTDSDPNGDGTDTIRNVETLEFSDMRINVGVSSWTITNWEGIKIGMHFDGSIFGDTIEGGEGSDFLYGGNGADTLLGRGGPDMFVGGKGNDTIRGGENGLDEWGNAGQDIAIYSGDESDYEITFYTADGEQSNTFEFDGYFTVKDSRTDEDVAEGTDTLYGIEAVQFDDTFVTFLVNNSFIDLDGDGLADVGDQQGTTGDDKLVGGDIDDNLDGKGGDDTLIGASGDDYLKGGSGNDVLLGGSNSQLGDVAAFSGVIASYTIETASTKYVGYKAADDSYEVDENGAIAIFDDGAGVGSDYTAEQLISVTRTVSGVSEVDYLAGIEYLEFADAFGNFEIEIEKDDYDYDGSADFVFIKGSLGGDTIGEGSGSITAADIAAANFIDGGLGADTIAAGAGDDTIDPGRDGLVNKVDGGDGNDVVVLSGKLSDWTNDDTQAAVGYTKYYSNSSTSQEIHLNDVEGIEFDDQFLNLNSVAVKSEIDNDGDGKVDQYNHKGTTGVDTVIADIGDKVDILDTGGGDDVISAGNGADIIFAGAGDDFIFGGANLGVDEEGNQDKDRAVFEGTYLTGTDDDGNAVAADFKVSKTGFVAQLSCDPGTGEVCLLTLNDTKDGLEELKDSAINATKKPTVFADIREIYVASVESTAIFDETTNQNGSYVTTSAKLGVNLVVESDGGTEPQRFDKGESTSGFDSDTMKLVKAFEMVFEDSEGSIILAKDANGAFVLDGAKVKEFDDENAVSEYATENSLTLTAAKASKTVTYENIGEKLDVYEIKTGEGETLETDIVVGVEQLEFEDTIVDLRAEAVKKVNFDVTTGITEINKTTGTDFGDFIESGDGDEIFTGGDGSDIFVFRDSSGSDRISDFKPGVDKLEVLSGLNETNIENASGVLARVNDTSDGALIDFGEVGGELHSVLLIGVSKEELTSDDFLMTYL